MRDTARAISAAVANDPQPRCGHAARVLSREFARIEIACAGRSTSSLNS